MKLYTIGFTKKSANEFFNLLKRNLVKTVIDIRLNNVSQLAGFTKGPDLKYFLSEICDIEYKHDTRLAPTKEILNDYKNKKISWSDYEFKFNDLLNERNAKNVLDSLTGRNYDSVCLLCSEPTANNCHRRLVAEYAQKNNPELKIDIIHI